MDDIFFTIKNSYKIIKMQIKGESWPNEIFPMQSLQFA